MFRSGKSTLGKFFGNKGYIVHDMENISGMFKTIDIRTGNIIT